MISQGDLLKSNYCTMVLLMFNWQRTGFLANVYAVNAEQALLNYSPDVHQCPFVP